MKRCSRCGGSASGLTVKIKDPKTGLLRSLCGICDLELADFEEDDDEKETGYEEYEPWA